MLVEDTHDVYMEMQFNSKPIVAYVYNNMSGYIYEDKMNVFRRVSEIFPNATFTFFDCSKPGERCQNLGINPNPSIYVFGAKHHHHSLMFTNEISLYAISEFIINNLQIKPTIKLSDHPILWKENVTHFALKRKCTAIFYTDREDRMSQLLVPTISELKGSFVPDDEVDVGEVQCNHDIDFCIEALGVTAVPLLRVYKDGSYSEYNGIREFPNLLDFINGKCKTYRRSEKEVNMSLFLDKCTREIFEKNEVPISYIKLKMKGSYCNNEALVNKVLSKVKEENVRNEIDRSNKILNEGRSEGKSRDFVYAFKWILERINISKDISKPRLVNNITSSQLDL